MSSRITACINQLRARREGAFMPFLVVGDPDMDATLALSEALVRAGADLLEFGFPFSDPPADGPVIQAADERALAAGTTPTKAFELLARVRSRSQVPIVLLMYYNLILQFGVDAFYARAAEVGVDGVLVADLPLEHAQQATEAAARNAIDPIYIVSELTSDERAAKLSQAGCGFLYLVARVGITGADDELSDTLSATIARLRGRIALPLMAGFGISTPRHVRAVLRAGADGAITGSALVKLAAGCGSDRDAMVQAVESAARELKKATTPG